jgi:hypothetical protein
MRSWIISLAIGLAICLFVMSFPLLKLALPNRVHLGWPAVVGLAASGVVGLTRIVAEVRQILGRRPVVVRHLVNPLAGNVRLENIAGPCKIALFLEGGFTRLHGRIVATTHSQSGVREFVTVVKRVKMYYLFGRSLSRRFPFLNVELWHRSAGRDFSPIMLRIPVAEPLSLISIHLQLCPTFLGSKLNARYPVHDEELLRCVVSKAG